MWFKSDISIYQKDDFRYYLKKCRHLGTVWEWLQRTSVIEESGTFILTIPLKGMFCEDYQVTETNFNTALENLASLKLIDFDNNLITILEWENNQGAYIVQKEYKKKWIAEKRQKTSTEKNVESMSNLQNIDSDSTKYPVDVLEKIREEEIRVDKSRVEKRRKEETIINTLPVEEKTILSSKLDPAFSKAEDCNTQAIQLLKASKPAKPQDPPPKTEGSQVFEAYSASYQERYNIPPVRNAKTNALCAQLVKRLGVDEAIQTVIFYLTHNDAFYFRSGHSLDLLVRDAEKLRTECLTGAKTTQASSQKVDKQQTKTAFWNEMLEKARIKDELNKQGVI